MKPQVDICIDHWYRMLHWWFEVRLPSCHLHMNYSVVTDTVWLIVTCMNTVCIKAGTISCDQDIFTSTNDNP